ncbi:MAG TPA: SusC/RagA family TonB-linked outer membrane protein [Candidatus Alistipes intestinipullorum]|nr:SusC/RagA family TonB-linked outer membrane protein [Candidatus Alistipes intestinipullorum]
MNNIIKLCFIFLLLSSSGVRAQNEIKKRSVYVKSVVLDESGAPVEGAVIHAQSGFAKTESDRLGGFSLKVTPDAVLVIEAKGLQTVTYPVDQVPAEIRMAEAPLYYEEESDVPIAFQTVKQGELINPVQIIRPAEEDGIVYSRDLEELVETRIAGLTGSGNIRGLGNALVVVDGVPRYKALSAASLMPSEIESITFLNSVSAAVLYGSEARNGAIVITTKRGQPGTQKVTVKVNYGVSVPKNLPEYLGSADYMTLYNEALVNDGLSPLYTDAEIANYRSGKSPYQYPDIDYYSSDYVKRMSTNSRVVAEFSGGNDKVTYYSNLGWDRSNDFVNFGPAKSMSFNRFNVRTNVDFKISDVISNTVIGSAVFNFDKSPRTDYFSAASTLRPNEIMPFIPISMLDRKDENINAMIEASNNIIEGKYLLGGSSLQKTNPFGDIYAGGYNQDIDRSMEFNNILKFDLNKFVKGLTAQANISFDFFNSYTQYITKSYAVYEPTWTDGKITGLTKFNEDNYDGKMYIGYVTSYRRFGFNGQVNYTNTFNNDHTIDAMVLVSGRTYFNFSPNSNGVNSNKCPDKFANLGIRLAYNYKNKYFVDFSSSFTNSVKLDPSNSVGFSPTLALAYNIAEENFMKNLSWLDFLKVYVSAGIIRSDLNIPGYYYYDSVYSTSTGFAWNEKNLSTPSVVMTRGYNPDLRMEERKEVNVGFDALLLDRSLQIAVNYYETGITDKFGKSTHLYPSYQSDVAPYGNDAGSDRFFGGEIAVNYTRKFHDFRLNAGVIASLCDSRAVSRNDYYAYDYLYRTGRPVDGLYMLEAEGLFSSQEEIDSSPRQTFGTVRPGDIKYKDQNGDDIIDSNDMIYVGRGSNPINLGVNLTLGYKNFTLYANGYGSMGGYSMIEGSYYRMSGSDKYSVIARERWTEATKDTARYPRLSSVEATNNNQSSTWWLFKNRYFNLSRVQLSYSFAPRICRKLMLGSLDVYLLASDVLLVGTQNAYRNQSTGSLQTRSFAIGLNATF